ncbi:hypothetical protein [Bacillus sp. SG-1]|uniref:hypothetical protein n=1 Tax=Bacillus sp. SG-1 TaxID=161544 RepID=UPI000154323D|nr:hypothetical protein [Bacillus sp. SG-1]EDL66661.1 hypothetical protein BSG1_04875 [Bacillus sp. SG-1]
MEKTLTLILNELKDLKGGVNNLTKGQQELRQDVNDLATGQQELRQDVNDLATGQQELRQGQQGLRQDVHALTEGQQVLIQDANDLKVGQFKLQKDVSIVKDNLISGLGPYFEGIEKHIDNKTDEIKDTLEGQQRVIDTLAARSIKHESEMQHFKRA